MYEYLLPIGSVVKLKDYGKKAMIFGILQKNENRPGKVFDYIGVSYPEGNFDPKFHLLFDSKDIEEVVFKGYEDDGDERKAFMAALEMSAVINEKAKNAKEE